MEIGVVVHGPGIIDSGYAIKIIKILSDYGNVRCRLGGTMGRTAVIDAALENVIDISLKLLPSESLELFNREGVDVIFLLNYGKSSETGHVFGYKTFSHYFKKISNEDFLATNHKPLYDSRIPVIQIERPGEKDGSIISWNVALNKQLKSSKTGMGIFGLGKRDMIESLSFNFEDLFNGLKKSLDLKKVTPEDVVSKYFSDRIEINDKRSIEEVIRSYPDYNEETNYTYRKIHGASRDENIFVNGIVVGYACGEEVVLLARDGLIFDIIGGKVKEHGVEKLGHVDLNKVIVKTGLLRKSEDVKPRILNKESLTINDAQMTSYSDEDMNSFKLGFVDHAAYDIYKFKNFDLVVTIGDDTTLVASDILYRFDIPIIGITDGDLDKVVEKGFVNEKSTIIELSSGFDDIVGHNIYQRIFDSNNVVEFVYDDSFKSTSLFKQAMDDIIKSHIFECVNEVVPTFVEKDYMNNRKLHDRTENFVVDEFLEEFDEELNEDSNGVSDLSEEYIEESDLAEGSFDDSDFTEDSGTDENSLDEDASQDLEVDAVLEELLVESDGFDSGSDEILEESLSGDHVLESLLEESDDSDSGSDEILEEPSSDEPALENDSEELAEESDDVILENDSDEILDESSLDDELDYGEDELDSSSSSSITEEDLEDLSGDAILDKVFAAEINDSKEEDVLEINEDDDFIDVVHEDLGSDEDNHLENDLEESPDGDSGEVVYVDAETGEIVEDFSSEDYLVEEEIYEELLKDFEDSLTDEYFEEYSDSDIGDSISEMNDAGDVESNLDDELVVDEHSGSDLDDGIVDEDFESDLDDGIVDEDFESGLDDELVVDEDFESDLDDEIVDEDKEN